MIRDEKTKAKFIKYMQKHPDERFWQSIRNFTLYSFVYVSARLIDEVGLKDTFYIESDE